MNHLKTKIRTAIEYATGVTVAPDDIEHLADAVMAVLEPIRYGTRCIDCAQYFPPSEPTPSTVELPKGIFMQTSSKELADLGTTVNQLIRYLRANKK